MKLLGCYISLHGCVSEGNCPFYVLKSFLFFVEHNSVSHTEMPPKIRSHQCEGEVVDAFAVPRRCENRPSHGKRFCRHHQGQERGAWGTLQQLPLKLLPGIIFLILLLCSIWVSLIYLKLVEIDWQT